MLEEFIELQYRRTPSQLYARMIKIPMDKLGSSTAISREFIESVLENDPRGPDYDIDFTKIDFLYYEPTISQKRYEQLPETLLLGFLHDNILDLLVPEKQDKYNNNQSQRSCGRSQFKMDKDRIGAVEESIGTLFRKSKEQEKSYDELWRKSNKQNFLLGMLLAYTNFPHDLNEQMDQYIAKNCEDYMLETIDQIKPYRKINNQPPITLGRYTNLRMQQNTKNALASKKSSATSEATTFEAKKSYDMLKKLSSSESKGYGRSQTYADSVEDEKFDYDTKNIM